MEAGCVTCGTVGSVTSICPVCAVSRSGSEDSAGSLPAGSEEIPSEPLVVGGGRIVCVTGGVLLPPPVEGFTLICSS